jgi:hypothetical protein
MSTLFTVTSYGTFFTTAWAFYLGCRYPSKQICAALIVLIFINSCLVLMQ